MPPRHVANDRSVIGGLMVHTGQTSFDLPAVDHPKWDLPKRNRGGAFEYLKEREGLSGGFAGFYDRSANVPVDHRRTPSACPPPPSSSSSPAVGGGRSSFGQSAANALRDGTVTIKQTQLVGDTARKHYAARRGDEDSWRPCFRTAVPDVLPNHPRGKKLVQQQQPDDCPHHEEIDDIPRGKKHVAAQEGQLGKEIEMFSRRRLVADETTGIPKGWKGPPLFGSGGEGEEGGESTTMIGGLRTRLQRTQEQIRNGIPSKNPGDLPYKTVEAAPGYVQTMNPAAPRCGYDKLLSRPVQHDRFQAKERSQRLTQEIADVRALPTY